MLIGSWCDPVCRQPYAIHESSIRTSKVFSKTRKYKINVQSTVFLYTTNELSENEIKIILFTKN